MRLPAVTPMGLRARLARVYRAVLRAARRCGLRRWPPFIMFSTCGDCQRWLIGEPTSFGMCLPCRGRYDGRPGALNRRLSDGGRCQFGCGAPAAHLGLCTTCADDHYE